MPPRGRRAGFGLGRRTVPLLLFGLWLLVRALAAASPADPVWLSGIYDGADFDDLVNKIALQSAACHAAAPRAPAPDPQAHPALFPGPQLLAGANWLTLKDRSPPLLRLVRS